MCPTRELFIEKCAKLKKIYFHNNYPIRKFNQVSEMFLANCNVITKKNYEVSYCFILKISYVSQSSLSETNHTVV